MSREVDRKPKPVGGDHLVEMTDSFMLNSGGHFASTIVPVNELMFHMPFLCDPPDFLQSIPVSSSIDVISNSCFRGCKKFSHLSFESDCQISILGIFGSEDPSSEQNPGVQNPLTLM
jgi:hypothetical protein